MMSIPLEETCGIFGVLSFQASFTALWAFENNSTSKEFQKGQVVQAERIPSPGGLHPHPKLLRSSDLVGGGIICAGKS